MKLSEVTLSDLKLILRVDTDADDAMLTQIMDSAKGYILSFTGLTETEIDKYPETVHAFNCLCSDMYNNVVMQVTSDKVNPTVNQILKSMAVNYV